MKDKSSNSLPLVACLIGIIGFCLSSMATAEFDVTAPAYGADGKDSADDFPSIQRALREAGTAARDSGVISTVRIPAGRYYVSSTLKVYPRTTILAEGAELLSTMAVDGGLLHGEHYDALGNVCEGLEDCPHGGYGQTYDVTIVGGTWDRQSPADCNTYVISIRHGRNLAIRNAKVRGGTNHMLNFSGCENVLVSNVVFRDAVKYTGSDLGFWGTFKRGDVSRYKTLEALHLDTIDAAGVGEPAGFPLDDTVCRNVRVQDCVFEKVFSGVGTHHVYGVSAPGLTISGCTFTGLQSFAIYGFSFTDLIFTDSTVDGGYGLACLCAMTGRLSDLTCSKSSDNAVYVDGGSQTELCRCRIVESGKGVAAVRVIGGSKALATSCVLDAPKTMGFSVAGASSLFAVSNEVAKAGQHAFYCVDGSSLTAVGNRIENPVECAFSVQDGSTATVSANAIASPAKHAIRATDRAVIRCRGNDLSGCQNEAVFCDLDADVVIERNRISSSASRAIHLKGTAVGSRVAENTIIGCANDGIFVESARGAVITWNVIKDAGNVGLWVRDSSGCDVGRNEISQTANNGLYLNDSTDCVIGRNVVTDASVQGIWVRNSTGCRILGNMVLNSEKEALLISGDSAETPSSVVVNDNSLKVVATAGDTVFDLAFWKNTVRSTASGNQLLRKGFWQSKDGTHDNFFAPWEGDPVISHPDYPKAKSAYSVTFFSNGGKGEMDPVICSSGKVYALPKCTFSKAGHRFVGWRNVSTGRLMDDSVLFVDLAVPDASAVLAAVWR